ncbi:MAG: hypothetical protein ACREMT_07425, partial [Vulcanimicrobiaceae bacterium]
MLVGWHVDSNIARRLSLIPRALGDVVEQLYGYHCDHTRQVTPAHRASAVQNDQKIFFERVRAPGVPQQAKSWGLADENIEELRVDATSRSYVTALGDTIHERLDHPTTTGYSANSFNHIDYPSDHVVPFLVDSLVSYPRTTVLAWSGAKRSLLDKFASAWRVMGFAEPIRVFSEATWLGSKLPAGCVWTPWEEACRSADAFIFDWGKSDEGASLEGWSFERDPVIRLVTRHFRRATRHERRRLETAGIQPRRIIGVNAICNSAEGIFNSTVGAALTPLATHIRQGFLRPPEDTQEVLRSLYIGEAGERQTNGIRSIHGTSGAVFYGPYLDLDSGMYRLKLEFAHVHYTSRATGSLSVEVRSNTLLIACRGIERSEMIRGRARLDFYMPREISDALDWPRVEFLLRTPGGVDFTVNRATLEQIDIPEKIKPPRKLDITPLLTLGAAGKRQGGQITASPGIADLVTYGPYFWLSAGKYRVKFVFRVSASASGGAIRAYVAH